MNLSLLDPRLIALLTGLIVILAVLAWVYVRNRTSATAGLRKNSAPSISAWC